MPVGEPLGVKNTRSFLFENNPLAFSENGGGILVAHNIETPLQQGGSAKKNQGAGERNAYFSHTGLG